MAWKPSVWKVNMPSSCDIVSDIAAKYKRLHT